ncbi:hypothetical protein SAMN04515671_0482 [Nakamurella panacisegetis]|uniref:Spermatogenesis-associated protein 20-like TRX domain-containing protein n=1 Tax=Nakamurella panacisegetis TaxID=1090615 RepID=A0A1H0IFC0_9ACTN|nr:thioredoxin domain-containing protein [Nakamurella panacisegetis]SDO30065.1 hypothetical protein SAMN04515671_0482 [Nakamurella panacisegetis]
MSGSRLALATSTYLRQHAGQPVDWWPWCDEAFAEAKRRDVPVLLSIGYASCHWCHVMARESFSDPAVAAQLNRDFVAIKVDREERPDVDAVYMTATQALTGSGGWPMTCFLTPDREPFYAGTYFPPEPAHRLPSFRQVLAGLTAAWTDDRSGVLQTAAKIRASLAEVGVGAAMSTGQVSGAGPLDGDELTLAAESLVGQMDQVNGGFPGAPKFPPSMVCEFLLRQYERTGDEPSLRSAGRTLEQMARGGIYDQLGGGFARYSVDSRWHVPHFEKMLDDNGLLLSVYAHHARLTGSTLSTDVVARTAEFLLSGLRTSTGAFAASLDADTAGVEGATYLWTRAHFDQVLGQEDGARAAAVFGLDRADHDEALAGAVLRLPADPVDGAWFDRIRTALLAARTIRPQPGRDDLIVLRSNGLAIRGLAEAGASAGRGDWIAAASDAARYLLAVHRVDGRWRRSSRDGVVGPGAAVLVDHADLAGALLALYQADGDQRWLDEASAVLDLVVARFVAPDGGFNDTADDAETLFLRPRDPGDGAAPSGASSIADALVTAGALTGRTDYTRIAERAMASVSTLMLRVPRSAGWHLAVAEALVAGPLQIAVAGHPGPARDELVALVRAHAPGGAVVVAGEPDSSALLADRHLLDGRPAVYVCRGFVCDRPVTSAAEVLALLSRPR